MRALSLLVTLSLVSLVYAADQTILGKQVQLKDPKPGVDPTKRKVVAQGKEKGSPNTIAGNPTVSGASLTVFANGTTTSSQVFLLPATLWSAAGTTGFKYKDSTGVAGAVKVAQIKASNGKFQIKAVILGKIGPISVLPPNLGTDGCFLFEITGGDRYHVLFPASPNSTIKKNDAKTFLVKDALLEGTCPGTVATTTTTSTSTTTTTIMCVPTSSGTFVDSCEGAILDTATGLHWEKKDGAGGGQNDGDLHDVDNLYSWAGCCSTDCISNAADLCQPNAAAAATCAAHADGGTLGCSTCAFGTCNVDPFGQLARNTVWDWLNQLNAANFAGHGDWRLPSEGGRNSPPTGTNELETILLAPFFCGTSPCINPVFGPTAAATYASSSTKPTAGGTESNWYVYFSNGFVTNALVGNALHVRAVR